MNLPNQLTVLRLILTAIFAVAMSIEFAGQYSIALILFSVAAFTDFLDGYLARKHNLITNFGKLMDPLADKVLMCAGFVLLSEIGLIPGWLVVAILTREFLVTGLRLIAAGDGKVVSADKLGKQKTIWQIVTLIYFLLFLASDETAFHWMRWLFDWAPTSPPIAGFLLLALSLVLTVWSGIGYVFKNLHVLRTE
tara:strand:- start:2369 stop:2950 length:582 start_codon:yes stop_codon:yes gene_type:complete